MRWFCPACEDILYEDIVSKKVSPLSDASLDTADKKDDLLTKLNAETTEMRITLNRVAAQLETFSKSESPKRKAAKFAWGDDSTDPICSVFPFPANPVTEMLAPPIDAAINNAAIQSSYCDKVKLNLKTNDNVL